MENHYPARCFRINAALLYCGLCIEHAPKITEILYAVLFLLNITAYKFSASKVPSQLDNTGK